MIDIDSKEAGWAADILEACTPKMVLVVDDDVVQIRKGKENGPVFGQGASIAEAVNDVFAKKSKEPYFPDIVQALYLAAAVSFNAEAVADAVAFLEEDGEEENDDDDFDDEDAEDDEDDDSEAPVRAGRMTFRREG